MSATSAPDIRQLQDRQLPDAKFPGDAKADFRVCIDPKAHEQVQQHAKENTGVEICGVLVGQWGRDEKGPFLSITASIRGEAATNKFAEVTFTHDTWSKINARMDKDFAGKSIVGWYHTHPDFGIFLSDRDRFIHEHFFNEPGQVALVVDPVRKQEGLFVWSAGKAVASPYYWIGDKITVPPPEKDGELRHEKRGSGGGSGGGSSNRPAQEIMESPMLTRVTLAMAGLCIFLLGYMLNGWLVSLERQRMLDVMQNSVGALQINQRMKLTQSLSTAASNTRVAATLLEAAVRGLGDADRQVAMQTVNNLVRASGEMEQMQRQYGMTDAEVAQLGALVAQLQTQLESARAAATRPASSQPAMATALPPATQPATAPAAVAK